jgi:hypothetical protein
MNTIPPRVEAEGMRAYEQVRAFEAVRGRRLPLVYFAVALLMFLAGGTLIELGRVDFGIGMFLVALFFSGSSFFHWRRLQARHRTNLQFLTELELRYGEKLPWIQVERHLTALARLQAELKGEQESNSLPEPSANEPK